jgi:hypothetical protein
MENSTLAIVGLEIVTIFTKHSLFDMYGSGNLVTFWWQSDEFQWHFFISGYEWT